MKINVVWGGFMINISVVVPVYKEELNVRPFLARIEKVFDQIGRSYEIIFALDPSPDRTEEIILEEIKRNPNIKLMVFSRRFGQPAAVMAGILNCHGENCVIIDIDLQDPPELIPKMYDKLKEGNEVVYAKRKSRKGEAISKIFLSWLGYKILYQISDVKIPRDTGEFRIITRTVIEELRKLNESHGYLRGLVAFIGFKQDFVEFDREERAYGKSKYNPYYGSFKIGLNGAVGFSNFLLSLSSIIGLIVTAISFLIMIYIIISKFIFRAAYPPGIPTLICVVIFIGGIQLISIGILGEYIGRIYDEVKRRPPYIIDKKFNF